MSQLRERFVSLDVFRGMTICLMIVVNTPGSGAEAYAPLHHAQWFGCTPTDLVYPSFLFAIGNAMSFSMRKYEALGSSAVWGKIIRRTLLIFLIGYLMYWFPFVHRLPEGGWGWKPIAETRIMGVLQRIALCYFFGALIIHFCSRKAAIIWSVALLLGYWALLYIFGDPGSALTLHGNAVLKLDLYLFGPAHLYHGEGVPFDPEGVLTTIPSIVNVVAGFFAGVFIQRKGKNFECISKLLMAGVLLIFVALCWDLVFPMSKKIWTSSFVLYTIGIDLAVIALLIYALEMRGWKRGVYFFQVFGRNPLFIYLLSELLVVVLFLIGAGKGESLFRQISIRIYQAIAPGPFGSLLFALSFMLLCWAVGLWLDKRKIYVKI
jgi:predicted acyltransferase